MSTEPMPADAAPYKGERFWNRIAKRYSNQPIADQVAYQRKLARTREHFRPDMDVLELGCGTGSTALLHTPYVKHIRAIEIARGKAEAQRIDNVTFERAPSTGSRRPPVPSTLCSAGPRRLPRVVSKGPASESP